MDRRKRVVAAEGGKIGGWSIVRSIRMRDARRRPGFFCVCDCGTQREIPTDNLERGLTTSCGCLKGELIAKIKTRHGASKTDEYRVWTLMWRRCRNPRDRSFQYYGGKGIGVAARWKLFENFLADMGRRPSAEHSIERKNSDLNYGPKNCVWVTLDVQVNNRSNTCWLELDGVRKPLTVWARERKLNPRVIHARVCLLGWNVRRAFEVPVRKQSA